MGGAKSHAGGPPSRPSTRRATHQILIDPIFGRYFIGRLLSTAGVWIHNIVAALLTFELTGSAFIVGLVSVVQFAPQMIFAPLAGALADRGDLRRQVVLGRSIVVVGSGGLALWVYLVGVNALPGPWPVILSALVVGVGFVIGGPAMQAMVPALVRPSELASAVALNNVPATAARAAGPAVGALVAVAAGPAAAFALAAVGNLVFALVMWRLPVELESHVVSKQSTSVRAGVRYILHDKPIIYLLVGVTAIGIGADPAITLVPALAEKLGQGADLAGLFASSYGFGAILAYIVLSTGRRWFGIAYLGTVGLSLMAISMIALVFSMTPGHAMWSFGLGGSGMTFALTSFTTQIQERIPNHIRGRVMALWLMAFVGSRPLAAGINGAIADLISINVALLGVASALIAAGFVCRSSQLAPPPMAGRPSNPRLP